MDPLHDLVHSMTPSEKGYFKKYASSQSEKDYLKLFDTIAGMEDYDEKKLVQKLKKALLVKHLPRTKNYLFQNIVRALLLYHEESSPKVIIANLLNEAEMLYSRGMLKHSRKRVDKAKVMARNGEWFTLWLDVLNQQGRLCDFNMYKPEELEATSLPAEIRMVTLQMTGFFELVELNQQQKKISNPSFLFRGDERRKKLQAFRTHPLLRDESAFKSVRAKLLFNYIHYLNLILLQDYPGALAFAQRYLKLLSENVNISEASPHLQMQAFNMLISCLQFLPETHLLEKYLNQLRSVHVNGNWMEAAKFQNYAAPALYFYHENFRKKEFLEVAQEAKQKLQTYQNILKTDLRLGIYVTLAEGYMKFGQYSEAVDIIGIYRQNPPKDIRHDYQNFLLFFYLISHYEMGNYQLVKNLMANTGQVMKRTREYSEIEGLMLKVFSTALDIPDKRTRNAALNELNEKIIKWAADSGKGRWVDYVSLISPFIQSKVKGIKYHEHILTNREEKNLG